MTYKPSEEGGWASLDSPSKKTPKADWAAAGAPLDASGLAPLPPHDLIPLLPRGSTVFDSLPARAIVLEPLAPAVGDGLIVARRPDSVGVVLIRGGKIAEVYSVNELQRISGAPALQRIREQKDATISSWRLQPSVVDIIPPLLRADPYYADLRLEWVNWERLLGDLRGRPGTFIVELITPVGRGVINLRDGLYVASFTDTQPELCEPSLLDEIAGVNTGSLRVLREEPAAAKSDDVAHSAPDDPEIAMIGVPPVDYGTVPEAAAPAPAPMSDIPELPPAPSDNGGGGSIEASATQEPIEAKSMLRQLLGLGPQGTATATAERAESTVSTATGSTPSVAVLLPDLKLIAFNHLHRAEPKLESMLDEAAADNRSLDWVASAIRSTPLLYVSQGTLDDLANEVLALGSRTD
ncbi:MAG: hypothetical protein JOY80_05285 [Candidatus Dormibacteraeota bacterium]|nr:hypothetical protein [Candidatus Dormibacteraeota bacterium]